MEQNVRNVHSYKKTPVIEVQKISQYFKPLLPSTLSSSLLSSPTSLQELPYTTFLSPSSSPFNCLFKRRLWRLMIWQRGSSLISGILSSLYSGGLMLWYIRIRMSLSAPSGPVKISSYQVEINHAISSETEIPASCDITVVVNPDQSWSYEMYEKSIFVHP